MLFLSYPKPERLLLLLLLLFSSRFDKHVTMGNKNYKENLYVCSCGSAQKYYRKLGLQKNTFEKIAILRLLANNYKNQILWQTIYTGMGISNRIDHIFSLKSQSVPTDCLVFSICYLLDHWNSISKFLEGPLLLSGIRVYSPATAPSITTRSIWIVTFPKELCCWIKRDRLNDSVKKKSLIKCG